VHEYPNYVEKNEDSPSSGMIQMNWQQNHDSMGILDFNNNNNNRSSSSITTISGIFSFSFFSVFFSWYSIDKFSLLL
jgi:hypothetical protein